MKITYLLIFTTLLLSFQNLAQSDGCSSATIISPTANCSSPTAGNTTGATQTIAGCLGTADDDVWYSFTATSTSHNIVVDGLSTFDPVVQLFSGGCAVLASIQCQDQTFGGGTETIYASGLTIGNVYTIRVYHYGAGSGTGNFTICVTSPPPAPSNDNCTSPTSLSVNAVCAFTSSTTIGATETLPGCAGTADDDVWFSFVATNASQTITVDPSSSMDPVVQLYSGSGCGTLTSLECEDSGFTDGNEVIDAVGLTPGTTYYIRVYDYYSSTGGGDFEICIVGAPTPIPSNDEPCDAIVLPAITASCSYLHFTTTGATATSVALAPLPSGCTLGSADGDFTAASSDVWFSMVVPASGNIYITTENGYGITDGVMALYSGGCGTLSPISCSNDSYGYPTASGNFQPLISETGLPVGSTIYLRYFGWGTISGDFSFCVSSPTNDECSNALYICDLNGYSASTSAAYSPDRPGTAAGPTPAPSQMFANNENSAGTNLVNGTDSGGPFGAAGPWGTGSPAIDVNIENNSWITFTAGASTAVLTVTIGDCWVGGYPSGGVQMQIFSGTNCDNFVPVSNFEESSTGFTITANGLTVGNDYYLMVDGYAGDICNYTITVDSGVSFPEIVGNPTEICSGASATLTAPTGATNYDWLHIPGTNDSRVITVNPSSTTTYTCVVSGVCDQKQTLTHTVPVNQLPTMTSPNATSICTGETLNIPLTSNLPSNYTWSASNNNDVSGETTISQVNDNNIDDQLTITSGGTATVVYSIIPTSTDGCVGPAQTVNVTVNPLPVATFTSVGPFCEDASAVTLSPTITGGTFSGTGVSGNSFDPASASTGNNTVTYNITDANTCSNFTQQTVVVNALPNANFSSMGPFCKDASSVTLSPTTGGGTFSGSGVSGTSFDPSSASIGNNTVTYNITDANTCSNSTQQTVVVNALPNASFTSVGPFCADASAVTLSPTTGGGTFSGTGVSGTSFDPASASIGNNTVTYNITDGNSCSNSTQQTVVVNDVPNANFAAVGPFCEDASAVTLSPTTSGGTFSGTGVSGTSFDPASASIGNNTVTYNITDGNSCSNSTQQTVVVNALPNASFTTVGPFCADASAVTLSPTTGGGTFSGTGVSGTSFDPASASIGNNTVTYNITDANTCSNSSQQVLVVNDVPNANFTAVGPFCADAGAVTLSPTTSGGTFSGTGVSGASFDPASASIGNNTVTYNITDGNSCSNSTQQTILVNALPIANAGTTDELNCTNTSLVLDGSSSSGAGHTYNWSTSGTGNIVLDGTTTAPTIDGAGTYTITVINTTTTCQNTSDVVITEDFLTPVANAGSTQQIDCANPTVTLSGGATDTSNPAYSWSPAVQSGGGTLTPTIASQGTYTLTVTNDNGCFDTSPVIITIDTDLPDIQFDPTVLTIDCNTSMVTVDASLSTPASTDAGVTYSWIASGGGVINGGSPTNENTLVVTAGGSYELTITDSNTGCDAQASFSVGSDLTNPAVSIAPSNDITCLAPISTIDGSGSATVPNITYAWTTSDGNIDGVTTNSTVNVDEAGTYLLTVTNNDNGCSSSLSETVVIDTISPIANAGSTQQITCANPTLTLAGSGTNTSSPTYSWSPAVQSGGATLSPTVATQGTYTLTVTNDNGCFDTSPVVITIDNSLPNINFDATPLTIDCNNSIVTIDASTSTPATTDAGVSYGWIASNGGIINGGSPTNENTLLVTSGGDYELTISDANTGCSANVTFSVASDLIDPSITIASSTTIDCNNQTITVDATGSDTGANFTNSWSTLNGNIIGLTDGISINADEAGTYTLTIVNSTNGCSSSLDETVSIDTLSPVADAGSIQTITCTNPTVFLDGSNSSSSNGHTYSWTPAASIVGSSTVAGPEVNASGLYTVTITETSNGCTDTDTVSVILDNGVPVPAVVDATPSITCTSSTVVIDGSPSTPTTGVTYGWLDDAGATIPGEFNNTLSVTEDGSYTLVVTNPSSSCTANIVITVSMDTVSPSLPTIAGGDINCNFTTLDLDASATANANDYVWSTTDGNITNGPNTNIASVDAPGTYDLIATGSNGCTSDTSIVITETPAPTAFFTATPDSGAVVLDVTFTNGSSNNFFNDWDFGTGVTSTAIDSSYSYDETGTYTVTLTVTDAIGCSDTYTDDIVVGGEFTIGIPNIFTPNGDGDNDGFKPTTTFVESLSGQIFNRWGQLMHEWNTVAGSWDGRTSAGEEAPDGTYYFFINLVDLSGEPHSFQGFFVLQR